MTHTQTRLQGLLLHLIHTSITTYCIYTFKLHSHCRRQIQNLHQCHLFDIDNIISNVLEQMSHYNETVLKCKLYKNIWFVYMYK